MRNPYGQSNFGDVRREGYFYADKTPFLPHIESHEGGYKYLVFLRPRRIGKSLLVSMLEHYYDLAHKDRFDELFGGLWIHEHPTPERGRYLALTLDFSRVDASAGAETLRRTFFQAVQSRVRSLLLRYRGTIPELGELHDRLPSYQDPDALMGELLDVVGAIGHKVYLLIDEYDNFANRLLASGAEDVYEQIARGTGFVRSFYAALKAGTGSGGLGRMFITGVSPILLDDLSSGFNILSHVSTLARFHTMVGFTHAEVERAVDELLTGRPALADSALLADRSQLLATMEHHYNGYRFSNHATERVFNSDLVLYFLRIIENTGRYPEQLLDLNVRTDYGRLQRIASLSGAAGAEVRALLETMLTEERITSRLVEQFGVKTMYGREQLVSLFYYMGMLTFGPPSPGAPTPELVIPNRVIRELQWEFLALSVKENERIWLDTFALEKALSAMAMEGDIGPLLAQFTEQVVARLGSKDLRQFNEKVLKLMLLAYIAQSRVFSILSEKEFSGGYCDLFLGLNKDVPQGRFAWMLEVKYLKTDATGAEIKRAIAQAYEQLARYTSDTQLVTLLTLGKELKAGALVFVGAKELLFRPWPPERRPAKKRAEGRAKVAPRRAVKKVAAMKKRR